MTPEVDSECKDGSKGRGEIKRGLENSGRLYELLTK